MLRSEITPKRIYKRLSQIFDSVKRGFFTNILLQKNDPTFLIIGAQKAATSSLAFYLQQHLKFVLSKNKEVNFFNRDDNYNRGLNWYKKQFINPKFSSDDCIYFEATPGYMYRKVSIERIRKHYPKIKLVVLLRNPVERAFSAWNMYRDFSTWRKIPVTIYKGYIQGVENNLYKEFYSSGNFPDFETCIETELAIINSSPAKEEPSLLRKGIYIEQLNNLFDTFPENQLLVLGYRDLVSAPKETLNKLLIFLGEKPCDWSFLIREKKNSRGYPEPIKEDTRNFLNTFYEKYNEELFDRLGYKPNW